VAEPQRDELLEAIAGRMAAHTNSPFRIVVLNPADQHIRDAAWRRTQPTLSRSPPASATHAVRDVTRRWRTAAAITFGDERIAA